MIYLRAGIAIFLFVRLVLLVPRLRALFSGKPLQLGQYRSIDPPTGVQVRWHRGFYGDPWISKFEPLPRDCWQ